MKKDRGIKIIRGHAYYPVTFDMDFDLYSKAKQEARKKKMTWKDFLNECIEKNLGG